MIEIVNKGFLTLPVTAARHGLERYGVSAGGAMDQCRYTLANRLVGNRDDAAALEVTVLAPGVRFFDSRLIALVGGVDRVTVLRSGERLSFPAGEAVPVQAGDELLPEPLQRGCRAYLAVSGGLRLNTVRPQPVKNGDRLPLRGAGSLPKLRRIGEDPLPMPGDEATLRVIAGVHTQQFSRRGLETFFSKTYVYTPQSDRMGIRFSGDAVTFAPGCNGNIISEGMMAGDIQITSSGQPILMMADCQTVGGYTKIGHVIAADLPLAAQLRPGARVRFRSVLVADAHGAWRRLQYRMGTCLVECEARSPNEMRFPEP